MTRYSKDEYKDAISDLWQFKMEFFDIQYENKRLKKHVDELTEKIESQQKTIDNFIENLEAFIQEYLQYVKNQQ